MDELTPSQWIAKCGQKLHERWHTVETAQLEEVAVEIWRDARLREMKPDEAAVVWLSPIVIHGLKRTDQEPQISNRSHDESSCSLGGSGICC